MDSLSGIGSRWAPDGDVRYRTTQQGRVGVLPRTCKAGRHDLAVVGYTHRQQDGLLIVSCRGCVAKLEQDHEWYLTLIPPRPVRAELDDAPYVDMEPHFVSRPADTARWGWWHWPPHKRGEDRRPTHLLGEAP